jgi:hypothetical protein
MRRAPRAQEEQPVKEGEEMIGLFSMRCCAGDGGAGRLFVRWPSVVTLQEEATNHPKVLRSKAVGAERCGKSRAVERGRYDPMKANESKPWMKCRNASDDIESGSVRMIRDEPGGCLFTGQVVSGMYAARAWVRLLHGTWEPVVLRDDQLVAFGLRLAVSGKVSGGRNREGRIPVAEHRGGPSGSSDEGPVMGLERSGRAVQARLLVNREVCGMS